MPGLICDPQELERLIAQRRETGADGYDETWEGLYVVNAMATPEHQWIVSQLTGIFLHVVSYAGLGRVYACVNVTDCRKDWTRNYRRPDVVVVLEESKKRCCDIGPALLGGPDFVAEVRDPEDKSFEKSEFYAALGAQYKTIGKIDFYASLGVRELLVVDRDSRGLHFYRLRDGRLHETAPSAEGHESLLLGLTFQTSPDARLDVRSMRDPLQRWII